MDDSSRSVGIRFLSILELGFIEENLNFNKCKVYVSNARNDFNEGLRQVRLMLLQC